MINPAKKFTFHDYLEVLWRRLWYLVIPFVLVTVGTGVYAFMVPKEYKDTTLILVTPQKVPEDFIRPTVTSRIEDRLQSIGQEIMSRTRLEQVITEFKLYQEEGKSKRLEEIVELMGGAVVIETIFAWPGLGLLTIQAIYSRDYPVVQASVLFLTVSFVLINLLVDVSYQFLDPRVRLVKK